MCRYVVLRYLFLYCVVVGGKCSNGLGVHTRVLSSSDTVANVKLQVQQCTANFSIYKMQEQCLNVHAFHCIFCDVHNIQGVQFQFPKWSGLMVCGWVETPQWTQQRIDSIRLSLRY